MGDKVLSVAMVASFPPPYGGISNWVLMVEKYGAMNDTEFVNIDTAPVSRGLDGRTLYDRIVRQGLIMLKKRSELVACIKKNRIDVIHIASSGQLATIRDIMMMKAARKYNIPIVYHLHFGRIPDIAECGTKEWALVKKAIELSNYTIAIDNKTKNTVKKYIPSARVRYVPNPFDIEKLDKIGNRVVERKQIITYVGWVVNTKGIEELLEAWQEIRKNAPEYILRIVGPCKEEYKCELKKRFDLQGVSFLGEKSNDEALLSIRESQIFILPSYTEGFPNVILEAMALGTPIISTSVGAISDMLSGDCGIVIEPKNSKAIVEALRFAINNHDQMMKYAKNAREKLLKEFEMSVVFQKYSAIWRGKL